ncbi:Multidrug and toxin extrusion protein 1 [Clonorchis sinensis]|uniref:Multidrug and toxin extrusion protein n=1 Tax=Clonorchis sinensis TaxID=79923 RepID=A0A419Q2M7_CLOSI|nr:Multidrug and toxin extrusion protein 1 [Clonorchis sinensis]
MVGQMGYLLLIWSGMGRSMWHSAKVELHHLIKLALPTMLTQLLRFINPSVSIMVCGHMSREELDASSLANTLINVLGLCIDTGFSSAFDTLFSQAYGSQNRRMLGIFLQRAICVILVIYSILACIHLNVEPILLLLRQDPLISSLTSEYLRYFLPGLACDFLFLALTRYLQAQNIVLPMVYASMIGTIFNLWAQYTFVLKMNLGIRASALWLSVSFGIMLLCEIAYILISGIYKETWSGFNLRAATRNWGVIFRMGIPGLFMVSLEEWCFEIMTFISGAISEVTLGAQAIAFQVQSLLYMIPLGLFTAVNVRVGQKLGAYDPDGARFTFRTAQRFVCIVALATGVPVVLLRNKLPLIFTEDQAICDLASELLAMLLLFQTCEGFAGVSEAVLLACGRQSLGAVIIFVGYYCIGMPLAFLFAFAANRGIIGAWTGLLTGFAITTIAYSVFAHKTNWIAEARKARRNICDQQDTHELAIHQELVTSSVSMDSSSFEPLIEHQLPNGDCGGLADVELDRLHTNPFELATFIDPEKASPAISLKKISVACAVVSVWIAALCIFWNRPEPLWYTTCFKNPVNRSTGEYTFCDRMLSESRFRVFSNSLAGTSALPEATVQQNRTSTL